MHSPSNPKNEYSSAPNKIANYKEFERLREDLENHGFLAQRSFSPRLNDFGTKKKKKKLNKEKCQAEKSKTMEEQYRLAIFSLKKTKKRQNDGKTLEKN